MKIMAKVGKMVRLKCETNVDWKEMIQSIPVQFLSSLPIHKLKKFFLELKNGMIIVSIRKAIEKNWILDENIAN